MMIRKYCRLLPALALIFAICVPNLASAQGNETVLPFLDVQGSAQKSVVGLMPAQVKHAYGFDQIKNQGEGQTIAIVDAFDHPTIEQDLKTFDSQFNLPDLLVCASHPSPVPCFQKVFASGTNPGTNDPNYSFWALEIALDVEWAHAIAPKASIILVEVASTGEPFGATLDDLLGGVDVAVSPKYGATIISMSWGGLEFSSEAATEDGHFTNRNVTFFAAAGDAGHGVIYPAASPYVMSSGGTTLSLDKLGNYVSEKAWKYTGGGLSAYEPEPAYQSAYPIPLDPNQMRGTPDVAYDADPNTGVAVFDSVPYRGSAGWFQVGGTSAGPPQWSGLMSIANSMRAAQNKPPLTGAVGGLYEAAQNSSGYTTYHDVSNGNNGNCNTLCKTQPGYDYLTGLGTPRADLLIPALVDLQK